MRARIRTYAAAATLLAACAPKHSERARETQPQRVDGTPVAVTDTTIDATFDAAGTAEPFRQAVLSTKLMGTVVAVLVREGDLVTAGQPLVRIDARDLMAKEAQVTASVADAEASHRDAQTQAARIRALYADSAAAKAQLDAAETGLARTEAGVRAARAARAEVGAMTEYATVRAPFAGVVTQRLVDPGAFAAPGAPLVAVQDVARLRIVANTTPDAVRSIRRGGSIAARIEGRAVNAVVEGVVPAPAGNMYTVNAVVSNADRTLLAGSTATLALPLGNRPALMIPSAALRRDGDLTGVMMRTAEGDELRWIRIGRVDGGMTEVISGLRRGDQVVVPGVTASTGGTASHRRS
jgi:RND family efflux transporter MFP subunit